jgi:hypothetical protein
MWGRLIDVDGDAATVLATATQPISVRHSARVNCTPVWRSIERSLLSEASFR